MRPACSRNDNGLRTSNQSCKGSRVTRRGSCYRWRTPSYVRACGSSAVTAGATTSVMAGAVNCSPRGRKWKNLSFTPLGAVAKFASAGKRTPKKDLGLIAMSYGNIYVASVAMGAKDEHTLKAFLEAEGYDGPSLIIAYSHCIAHGINMTTGMSDQKSAVQSGQWLLYRYDPNRAARGE